MITVSNTEVTSYNVCTRQHYYQFVLKLAPRYFKIPLYRGIVGHEALESYYKTRLAGGSIEDARESALTVIKKEIANLATEDPKPADFMTRLDVLNNLVWLIEAYAEFYRTETFKILHVEEVFSTPLSYSDLFYGMKLDLLIEQTTGEFRGEVQLMDHKFIYNFFDRTKLELNGQGPKYINTLRDNGYRIKRCFFNQIRYRSLKSPNPDDIFRRTDITPKPQEIRTIWTEQELTAKDIVDKKRKIIRTLSPIVCEFCNYTDLCKSDLLGQDTEKMKLLNYVPSTYGYTDMNNGE